MAECRNRACGLDILQLNVRLLGSRKSWTGVDVRCVDRLMTVDYDVEELLPLSAAGNGHHPRCYSSCKARLCRYTCQLETLGEEVERCEGRKRHGTAGGWWVTEDRMKSNNRALEGDPTCIFSLARSTPEVLTVPTGKKLVIASSPLHRSAQHSHR